MGEPVASKTQSPPAHGISVNRIGNLLRRVSIAEPSCGEDDEDDEQVDKELPLPIPRDPLKACLTVHVKNCQEFNKNSSIKKGTQGFLRVSVGGKVKCTMVQLYKDPKACQTKFPLYFNEWKHFSIQIPKNSDNPMGIFESHRLVVELIFFEKETGVPKLIGKTFVKLLDILNKSQVNHLVDLKHKRQIICKLELEMVITYGSLGYGYSHQLKHPMRDMESLVDRSLFLRCPPPEERKDAHYNVVTPKPVDYPDFIRALTQRETTDPADSPISPIILKCMERRGRVLHIHEAMEAFESSEDGVQYLENLVLKRGIPTDTPWRVNKKLLVLSKWRNKANMVSTLLKFQKSSLAKKPRDDTDGTAPMPMQSVNMQQENKLIISQNEVCDVSEISPRKTLAAASGLSSQSAQNALSSPAPRLSPSDQDTTPKSTLDHKESPCSSVASCSMEHPALSRANSNPRHVTLVLPESACTSASTLSQPSTTHIPQSTQLVSVPHHLASHSVLIPLTEEGEEEEKVNAPLSSSFITSLSSLTLTPEVARTLHASPVCLRQQSQHGPTVEQEDYRPSSPKYQQQQNHQPSSPKYQQQNHQPSSTKYQQQNHQPSSPKYQQGQNHQPSSPKYQQQNHLPSSPKYQQGHCQQTRPRYKPYYKPRQESLFKGNSDREQRGVASCTLGGVRDSEWTPPQRDTAGIGSMGSGWKGLGCLSSREQREEESPSSSTTFRPTPLRDLAPPQLLGAWTENIATVPIPIGKGGGGLPAALGTITPLPQRISPPSTPPSSYRLSDSPLTGLSIPPLTISSRVTDTNSPGLETGTLNGSSLTGSRWCELNPPAVTAGKTSSGNSTEKIAQSPGASTSTDPLTSRLGSFPTGGGLESGQWSLLSDIDMSPLRSGIVFSPLSPISSTIPLTPSPNSPPPGCHRGSMPGKDRHRSSTPGKDRPYHRQNRDCYRKM